jgi:oligoendopeptidase F
MDQATAAGITWNLTDLYNGPDDPRIIQDLDAALASAQRFAQTYRGTIRGTTDPSSAFVADAVATMESILERVGRACAYADLVHAADVTPPAHGALVALTQDKA